MKSNYDGMCVVLCPDIPVWTKVAKNVCLCVSVLCPWEFIVTYIVVHP